MFYDILKLCNHSYVDVNPAEYASLRKTRTWKFCVKEILISLGES
jgi:hypothetical protein